MHLLRPLPEAQARDQAGPKAISTASSPVVSPPRLAPMLMGFPFMSPPPEPRQGLAQKCFFRKLWLPEGLVFQALCSRPL